MSLLYMSQRGKNLLNVLLAQSDYISLNNLAKALDVSRRTVYYDIKKVNIWLEFAKLPALKVVREKGIFIPENDRKKITSYLEADDEKRGDPVRIRALFLLYFGEMISLFEDGTFSFFNPDNVMDYYNRLKDIEQKLEVNYVDRVSIRYQLIFFPILQSSIYMIL